MKQLLTIFFLSIFGRCFLEGNTEQLMPSVSGPISAQIPFSHPANCQQFTKCSKRNFSSKFFSNPKNSSYSVFPEGREFDSSSQLFRDLEIVERVDCVLYDELPFFYNSSVVGGYFVMPSARFPKEGAFAIGGAYVPPYEVYGANIGVYSRIELSANYRVFRGVLDPSFGCEGFGDDADRIGNVKLGLLMPEDGLPHFPALAFGLDDFIGTKRFSSQYFVATKSFLPANLEVSLGYGWGRLKGVFGGATWTPFRQTCWPILKNISAMVEYDANNYKKHCGEHPDGRVVSSRFNGGLAYQLGDVLQVSVSSVRGQKLGAFASLRYPLGTTDGIFPKVDDPPYYCSPVDSEPLGPYRSEKECVADIACALGKQGFDLYDAYLYTDECEGRTLYLKVINTIYRKEQIVRLRLEDLLSSLVPSNVENVKVVIEAEGVVSHSYCFRNCDLQSYRLGCMGCYELDTISPITEAGATPGIYDAALLFERHRDVWTLTARPRAITFFGATSGKFKYSLGLLASLQGFLPGGLTYRVQGVYSAYSSMHGLTSKDRLNPSELLHVRTDAVRYYQGGRVRLEQAFLQRSYNTGCGCFFRLAGGYFEPAYAGGATEFLFYPVRSNWAIGAEAAVVWKRRYQGLGFFRDVPRFNSRGEEVFEKYTGVQYFLDLYYRFRPLDLLFKVKVGQFLAKDKGARFEAIRLFKSGARFSLWVAATDGGDKVNGRTYFDKGFTLTVPFDIFLKKSSRTLLNYSMAAWLRDVGAASHTGIPLFSTLYEERHD